MEYSSCKITLKWTIVEIPAPHVSWRGIHFPVVARMWPLVYTSFALMRRSSLCPNQSIQDINNCNTCQQTSAATKERYRWRNKDPLCIVLRSVQSKKYNNASRGIWIASVVCCPPGHATSVCWSPIVWRLAFICIERRVVPELGLLVPLFGRRRFPWNIGQPRLLGRVTDAWGHTLFEVEILPFFRRGYTCRFAIMQAVQNFCYGLKQVLVCLPRFLDRNRTLLVAGVQV